MVTLPERQAIWTKPMRFMALVCAVGALVAAYSLVPAVGETGGATQAATSTPVSDTSEDGWLDQELLQELSESERHGVLRTAAMTPTFSALSELSGFVDGGYSSSDSDTLLIFWHGDLTEAAESIIAEASTRGLEVTVEFLDYSVEEIERAADELILKVEDLGLEIHKIRIHRGYVGIDLVVDDDVSDEDFVRAELVVNEHSGHLPISLVREPRDAGAIIFPAHVTVNTSE